MEILDGNEAAASVAYRLSEVIAIYPITPSSQMGEWADQWSAEGRKNIFGTVPKVVEMQSEGGAAGALHGAVQAGALGTTFTASQGLLLMIPNMYKIAGELTACVIHVAARTVATHALSIFGDHSDVMATRATGFAFLSSDSVQEAQDFALIAHAASLESRIPFLHFFDGFRTSHELNKIHPLTDEDLRALIDAKFVRQHRDRALSPDRPMLRGTAQNPDVFFQAREAINPFYRACPTIVQDVMDRFARRTGRAYRLFDYVGDPRAERVIILMGSSAGAAEETIERLIAEGEKVGLLKVRLFRPFDTAAFAAALPKTTRAIAVLDRTKEPGGIGEPLYLDVVTAISEAWEAGTIDGKWPRIIGGRYGLSSKEFTPAMVKAVFDELRKETPKNHFTVGIHDDVTHTSLAFDPAFSTESPLTVRALFYGLGSDGTVGANKNSIAIIGENTPSHAQGYFVYDSKKSGSVTVSHLRFGPDPIRSTYLINKASFIGCHQFAFLERMDVLAAADQGATFLLNAPYAPDEVWNHLPHKVQQQILDKELRFFVIDAYKVARQAKMGGRINTIMQTCFFAVSGVLPQDAAIGAIKTAIQETYGKRGDAIVQQNFAAVDTTLAHLHEVTIPATASSTIDILDPVPTHAPAFVHDVLGVLMAGYGDSVPTSALPPDGTFPTGTAKWEKLNIAQEIPVWDEDLCIQCGKCVLVCPHAVIRAKVYEPSLPRRCACDLQVSDSSMARSRDACVTRCKWRPRTAPDAACASKCARPKARARCSTKRSTCRLSLRFATRRRGTGISSCRCRSSIETASRMRKSKIHNCSSRYSNFPGRARDAARPPTSSCSPNSSAIAADRERDRMLLYIRRQFAHYALHLECRRPRAGVVEFLFEDNAEFGLGMRLALDKRFDYARELVRRFSSQLGGRIVSEILEADQSTEAGHRGAAPAGRRGQADDGGPRDQRGARPDGAC